MWFRFTSRSLIDGKDTRMLWPRTPSTLATLVLALPLFGLPGAASTSVARPLSGLRGAPSTSVVEFPLPHPDSRPYTIVAGRNGNLWFTESNRGVIGEMSRTGEVKEHPLPD